MQQMIDKRFKNQAKTHTFTHTSIMSDYTTCPNSPNTLQLVITV